MKQQLIHEVQKDQAAHAYLFFGKSGYGALPVALAFAQYILCENKQEADSCGECSSCKKVEDGQHPDLHYTFPLIAANKKLSKEYYPVWREQLKESAYFDLFEWTMRIDDKKARNPIISTEESTETARILSLKSFEGGYKIMVIWLPELMNAQASNRLLKLIEEPPGKTLILLVSEMVEQVLPTIVSRTRTLSVPRIDIDSLTDACKSTFTIDEETAASLAARVDGDFIEALNIRETLDDQHVNRELFVNLMRVAYRKNVHEMLNWVDSIADIGRIRQKVFVDYSLHMFRQSVLKNYTGDQLVNVSREEHNFLDNFSRFITNNNIFTFMKEFNQAHYHIERNANPRILFTNLCFQVMRSIHAA